MKKSLILLTLIIGAALIMTACGGTSSSLGVLQEGDNVINIEAENADKDMEGSSSIEVVEGEQIYIEPSLESGEIKLEFYNSDDEEHENLITDFDVSGAEPGVVGIGAGEFSVVVKSLTDGTTGKITVSAKSGEGPEQWTEAETAEEAAKGAGGDDDFGLSADDISSLVNSIQ